jgi:hypothetical protein
MLKKMDDFMILVSSRIVRRKNLASALLQEDEDVVSQSSSHLRGRNDVYSLVLMAPIIHR